MNSFEGEQSTLPGLTNYDMVRLSQEIDHGQATLPGLTDRDMAWLDPEVIELAASVNFGEETGTTLLETVRSVEAAIALGRKRG